MKKTLFTLSIFFLFSCSTEIEKKYNLKYYSGEVSQELGLPTTLDKTDGTYWHVCFKKVNHKMIIRKSDKMIISVQEGCN